MSKPIIILIAGPSGAGKDSLIKGAKANFIDNTDVSFVRRHITRPPGKDEDNVYLPEQEFFEYIIGDMFFSYWKAHGYMYGILKNNIINGVNIISVSRTVIADIKEQNDKVFIVEITADRETLRERLQQRRRETDKEIDERLNRYISLTGENVYKIINNGTLEEGVKKLNNYISSFLPLLTS